MFVLTLNKRKNGKLIAIVLAVILFALAFLGCKKLFFKEKEVSSSKEHLKMETTQQMADYVLSKGYTVDLQSAQVKEVKIPKKFDTEFENFNRKISQTDGLSLEKYKNDKVNKWTFDITDYGVKDKTAVAVLLVKKEKLIGAYILQQPEGTAYAMQKDSSRTDALE